jgi:hypothetical protein
MDTVQLRSLLQNRYGESFKEIAAECYEVNQDPLKLLLILSQDLTWLRVIVPVTSASNATSLATEFLAANFDETLDLRYALHQDVLWGVFQHSLPTLDPQDLLNALDRLAEMKQVGINKAFSRLITQRVREVIRAAKEKGETLQQTIQTIDRLYAEGVMGGLDGNSALREEMMAAWRYQLTRLWDEPEAGDLPLP